MERIARMINNHIADHPQWLADTVDFRFSNEQIISLLRYDTTLRVDPAECQIAPPARR